MSYGPLRQVTDSYRKGLRFKSCSEVNTEDLRTYTDSAPFKRPRFRHLFASAEPPGVHLQFAKWQSDNTTCTSLTPERGRVRRKVIESSGGRKRNGTPEMPRERIPLHVVHDLLDKLKDYDDRTIITVDAELELYMNQQFEEADYDEIVREDQEMKKQLNKWRRDKKKLEKMGLMSKLHKLCHAKRLE